MNIRNIIIILVILIHTLNYGIAQNDCGSPVVITNLPYSSSGLITSPSGPSYEVSGVCNDNYQERHYLFTYSSNVEEVISIDLSIEGGFYQGQAGIYITTDCAQPPSSCFAFEEGSQGEIDLSFTSFPGSNYYIFIGTEESTNFDISITKYEVTGIAINKQEPTQTLDVNGSIRLGESADPPYEGTLKWDGTNKELMGYNGTAWENMKTRSLNDLDISSFDDNTLVIGSSINLDFIGDKNCYIGRGAGAFANTSTNFNNTLLGYNTGTIVKGINNTLIGSENGIFQGNDNIALGHGNGRTNYSGSNNILIGNNLIPNNNININDTLIIDSGYDPSIERPLIEGNFSSNELSINGEFTVNGLLFGSGTSQINTTLEVNSVGADQGLVVNTSPGFIGTNGILINHSSNSGRPALSFNIQDSRIGSIYGTSSNSIVIIAGDSPGNRFNFESNGDARKATAGEWLANSDSRLKKDIASLDQEEMLSKVLKMRGVTYAWDDQVTEFSRPEGTQLGFIAQDIQEVWPEKVTEDGKGYLQTAYGTYDPVFVEAIKALNAKIEQQGEIINLLKAEIELMKSTKLVSKHGSEE